MSIEDTQMAELDFQIVDNWKLTAENESLREQNAVLRQQLTDVTESMGKIEERCAKLRNENVNLRQLVEDIDEVANPFLWEFIARRMHELGIDRWSYECD